MPSKKTVRVASPILARLDDLANRLAFRGPDRRDEALESLIRVWDRASNEQKHAAIQKPLPVGYGVAC